MLYQQVAGQVNGPQPPMVMTLTPCLNLSFLVCHCVHCILHWLPTAHREQGKLSSLSVKAHMAQQLRMQALGSYLCFLALPFMP